MHADITLKIWEVVSLLASPIIALIAVVFGLLVQLRVAGNQIRSTTVSANRQAWINTLRDNVAALWAFGSHVRVLRISYTNYPAMTVKIQDEARQGDLLLNKIRLSINPDETDHLKLVSTLECLWAIADSAVPSTPRTEEWRRAEQALMAVARPILKKEWERVKRGN